MIEIHGLRAGYPGKDVLQNVCLSVPEGEITVIVGPNGCGKSTLLKALCGIIPAGGRVCRGGAELSALPQRELARQVAYLAQNRPLPDITVRRLVLHGRFPYLSYPRRYRAEDLAAADAAMERMGISQLAETPVANLSGGQRQKVYIAMALAQDTPIILLDEPTTYLDIRHQLQMMDQVRALKRDGKTVIMVLHDLSHAMQTADTVVVMADGGIVTAGIPEEVFRSGSLQAVFGVEVERVRTGSGWHYYCEGGAL